MIARAISQNKTLKHLDMTRNDIDDNGLRYQILFQDASGKFRVKQLACEY